MSRRTIGAYVCALRFVNDKLIELVGSIIIDFECAMRKALQIVTPTITILGCLFHYDQALLRKAASIPELHKLIRTNKEAYFEFRKYQSLALLPSHMIKDAFVCLLRETLKKYPVFAPFIDYYKKEWINKVKPVHFSVFKKDTRTTGAAEAYNCKINQLFRTHGSMFQFAESVQKEEAIKADEFSRDVSGVPQIDRRKTFYKKRSALIERYSNLLESRKITTDNFLSVMANLNNKIINDEKDIVIDEANIEMAITADLFEGEDLPDEAPDTTAQSIQSTVNEHEENRRTRRRATSTENESRILRSNKKRTANDAEIVGKNTRKKRATVASSVNSNNDIDDISDEAPINIDMQSTSQGTQSAGNQQTKRQKNAPSLRSNKNKTTTQAEIQTGQTKRKNKIGAKRANESIDSEDESESVSFALMERITRNGSAMRELNKRFAEIEKQDSVDIDSDSFLCILCYKKKKNTILLPCLHQHTCEACWLLWKIRQINNMQPDFDNDDDDDQTTKPKCPVCRQGVDQVQIARN